MRIIDKHQFYELSNSNRLGNRVRMFNNLKEALDYDGPNKLSFRYAGAWGSNFLKHDLTRNQLIKEVNLAQSRGARLEFMKFSEDFPAHANRLFNADVWRSPQGLYINYSYMDTILREALRLDGHHAQGIQAITILKEFLDVQSYEFLEYLLDTYDNHAIELSSWDVPVGIFKWNTIFWEVRAY